MGLIALGVFRIILYPVVQLIYQFMMQTAGAY
jgi:hypothetical protein